MLTRFAATDYVLPIKLLDGPHRALTHLALFTGRRHVFVKAYPADAPRGLLNDIVGYLMASHACIDQPKSGIIPLPAATLERAGIACGAPSIWCFASVSCVDANDRRQGSVSALFRNNLKAARPLLENWSGFARLVAFDTWLANIDRNTGNLLLTDGGRIIPIDHSDILTGPAWNIHDLLQSEDAWTLNKLIDIIWPADDLPLPIRSAILKSASEFQAVYAKAREDLYKWLDGANAATHRAHHFIWKRTESAPSMTADRLCMML